MKLYLKILLFLATSINCYSQKNTLSGKSLQELNELLDEAVANEDYEKAELMKIPRNVSQSALNPIFINRVLDDV